MEQRKRTSKKVEVSTGEENCWVYQGKCLTEPPEGEFGFVYKITNKTDGRIYVGKKQFTFRKKTKLSKKARVGTRKRIEVTRTDSGWLKYWGSSRTLLEDIKSLGEENFEREVLCFAKNKTQLSYYEVLQQVLHAVLTVPSYNGWISCRIYKNKL